MEHGLELGGEVGWGTQPGHLVVTSWDLEFLILKDQKSNIRWLNNRSEM